MSALWQTFTFWEQACVVVLGAVFLIAAAGWVMSICAGAFDLDALDEQRPEGE